MQYFVIWPDGQKFGPADVNQLNSWVQENRINPDTELESVVDGSRLKARDLPGLVFPVQPAQPADQPATPAQLADPVAAQPADPTPSAPAQGSVAATPQSFFVIGTGGQKYGPADVATLTQWASENRLTPTTELEDPATGLRQMASQVPGIVFPVAVAGTTASQSGTYTPQGPSTGGTVSPYGAGTQASNYPRNFSDPDAGKTEAIISFICSGIGLLCCPCLFSVAGIILGSISKNKGHQWGNTALILGICSLVGGVVLGIIINVATGAFANLPN